VSRSLLAGFPLIVPMALGRAAEPFDDPDWLFELKYDGFRALAYVDRGRALLLSRRGRPLDRFGELAAAVARELALERGVVDGEVVCLDAAGCPDLAALPSHRAAACYVAFDLPWAGGEDLRPRALVDRKARLRAAVPARSEWVLYADHVGGSGRALFAAACAREIEGIVAKHRHAPYGRAARHRWLKIRNPAYAPAPARQVLPTRGGAHAG
jgi:bifunctional non-homologous end joining protein LigD